MDLGYIPDIGRTRPDEEMDFAVGLSRTSTVTGTGSMPETTVLVLGASSWGAAETQSMSR